MTPVLLKIKLSPSRHQEAGKDLDVNLPFFCCSDCQLPDEKWQFRAGHGGRGGGRQNSKHFQGKIDV